MTAYEPGEVVDLTIRGARVVKVRDDGEAYFQVSNGTSSFYVRLTLAGFPGVSVNRVAPPEWPPQVEDLWRDRRGRVWFAVDTSNTEETDVPDVWLMDPGPEPREVHPDEANQDYGPFRLVHRETTPMEWCDTCGDCVRCEHQGEGVTQ